MMDRRTFLGAAAAGAATPSLRAQDPPAVVWSNPVVDIHLHPKRDADGEIRHMTGCGVATAVILAPASAQTSIQEKMQRHQGRMLMFSSVNVAELNAVEVLTRAVHAGAIGLGELKSRGIAADGPEMRRIYELAGELQVPVLIHFQDFPQSAGDGTYNAGITRFPAVLKAYPKTIFIGHGDSFWANISAEVPDGVSYPIGRIKRGGLTDRMLSDFDNLYGDLSANSGRNALGRDPGFAADFLARHAQKLMFGSDCSCMDGNGAGQQSQQPFIKGKCVARETLTALKELAPSRFRQITWGTASKLLKIPA